MLTRLLSILTMVMALCPTLALLSAQGTDQSTLRYYVTISIPANQSKSAQSIQMPAGNAWKVVSISALASVGNIATSDVDTFLVSNPTFELRASEGGSLETYLLPGAVLTAIAQKKKPQIGAATIVIIVTVRRP